MPALVWIHFEPISDVQAKCKYCGALLTVNNGSTKGLWTHVSRKHKDEHLNYNYEADEAVEQMQAIAQQPIVRGDATSHPVKTKATPEKKPPTISKPRKRSRPQTKSDSVGAVLKTALRKAHQNTAAPLDEKLQRNLTETMLLANVKRELSESPKLTIATGPEEEEDPPLFRSIKREIVSDDEEDEASGSEIRPIIFNGKGKKPKSYREALHEFGYNIAPDMEHVAGGEPVPSFNLPPLTEAFRATVTRDYEKAITLVRGTVKSDHAFNADDLELLDHVFACVLNTSHYDETMIEVCWEWIDAFERPPRSIDPRVVSGSQLSIYFAYHTICRVQDRMPKKANSGELRRKTWARIVESFEYLTAAAIALWKTVDLDRLEVFVNWSYLALQYAEVCDEAVLLKLKEAKEEAAEQLGASMLLENGHLAGERVATLERNITDACLRKGITTQMLIEAMPEKKKARMADG